MPRILECGQIAAPNANSHERNALDEDGLQDSGSEVSDRVNDGTWIDCLLYCNVAKKRKTFLKRIQKLPGKKKRRTSIWSEKVVIAIQKRNARQLLARERTVARRTRRLHTGGWVFTTWPSAVVIAASARADESAAPPLTPSPSLCLLFGSPSEPPYRQVQSIAHKLRTFDAD
ncbi:hypothetical protein EVAR_51907_1 [Eumeta japonica]|uniref:Uncharacterized protein n=1 Tax=Eumeta variegata TaxID=151549 RepID=A0A4C1XFF3_EUMVA|nr:hypothetical protein EVAR_51907_1 [Eumeta japonica]